MRVVTQIDRTTAFWQLVQTPESPQLDQGFRQGTLALASLTAGLNRLSDEYEWSESNCERLTALALLYHDHHNEAHDLVQDLVDAEGALVHAILHRREPDFWNARYWFRRVADHSVYRMITPKLKQWVTDAETASLLTKLTLGGWMDPLAFVDACEDVHRKPSARAEHEFLRRVQQAEFEALVEYLL
jgi:hypothetical protein